MKVVCSVSFIMSLDYNASSCTPPTLLLYFTVENVKEVLKLSVEQKGAVVPIGELTVYLDGLTVTDQEELAPLTNGNSANGTSKLIIYKVFGWMIVVGQ